MMNEAFRKFAQKISTLSGSPYSFGLSIIIIVIWAALGPIFKYSDTWQLVINTGTTIITFLMVFLIQNTQNRETKAINLKLDELIRANKKARNRLIELEDLSDEELEKIHDELSALQKETAEQIYIIHRHRSKRKK